MTDEAMWAFLSSLEQARGASAGPLTGPHAPRRTSSPLLAPAPRTWSLLHLHPKPSPSQSQSQSQSQSLS